MSVIKIISSQHSEMIDFTTKIKNEIPTDFSSGICHIFCQHTTAGLTINENADPDVKHDILAVLEKRYPWVDSIYNHLEGNSSAHIKSSLMGFSQTVPIINGDLALGVWQGIYFCEFDGPRERQVLVQFIRDY